MTIFKLTYFLRAQQNLTSMKFIFRLLLCFLLLGCESSLKNADLEHKPKTDFQEPKTPLESYSEPSMAESLSAVIDLQTNETDSRAKTLKGEASPYSFQSFLNKDFVGTDFTVGNLLTDWGTHKSYYATYRSDGLKISATLHVPTGNGPFPILILNHGYFPPSEYTNGYGFGREQKYFARQGYAVLHIDYRGYGFSDPAPESPRLWGDTGYAADAINAALALKTANLPYLDTNRIGLFGHSLGGGVTLNAALARPDLFAAGVMWGPVSSDYWNNFNQWRRDDVTPEQKAQFEAEFGSLDDQDSFLALSAFPYLEALEVPLLIQHGTADESCPVEWSRSTAQQLQELGKNVEYIEYEGFSHVFWNQNWDKAIADAQTFLEVYLTP